MDLLSIPNYYIKKGRPHGHRYGKKPGDRVLHRQFAQEEVQKEVLSGYPRPVHTRRKSSARTCLTPVALRKCVVKWTTWRTKTTRITQLQKKFEITELIGGFDRTKLVPIQCQSGTDLTSNKHCLPCDSSKTKKMQLIRIKDGRKAILRLGGTGKDHDGILLMSITTKTYPAPIDQGNLIEK